MKCKVACQLQKDGPPCLHQISIRSCRRECDLLRLYRLDGLMNNVGAGTISLIQKNTQSNTDMFDVTAYYHCTPTKHPNVLFMFEYNMFHSIDIKSLVLV